MKVFLTHSSTLCEYQKLLFTTQDYLILQVKFVSYNNELFSSAN